MQDVKGRPALVANNLPTSKTLSNATNATPIVITTTAAHKLLTGEVVTITGVTGNTAANGTFVVVATSSTQAQLTAYPAGTAVAGTGAYTGGPGSLISLGFGKYFPIPNDSTDGMQAATVNVPFEALADRTEYLMYRAGPNGVLEGRYDTQVFTSTGANTWTKPSWVQSASTTEIVIIGAGGGGGSGERNAALPITGGSGGGGGAIERRVIRTTLLSSTETVTIGAGGAKGNAQTVNSTPGNDGADGGDSTFGGFVIARGGKKGLGGGGGATVTGGSGAIGTLAGGAGGDGGYGVAGTDAVASPAGAPGGGGGGGLAAGPTFHAGGKGALTISVSGSPSNGGSTNGQSGGSGSNGSDWAGGSPGGGASSNSGVGGSGGNTGGYGVGGAGGGASSNGSNSGAGSDGGPGFCLVITRL